MKHNCCSEGHVKCGVLATMVGPLMAFPDKPSKIQIDPLFVPLTYLQILFNDKPCLQNQTPYEVKILVAY